MITYSDEKNLIKYSIDTIDGILKAKNKAKKVIKSCKNNKQLDGAKKFINLYELYTKDVVGMAELEIQLLAKRKSL
jgi:hypothetical protein|tara:strand:- start:492 stop:719 length:228 start_codon:yes stop_codon:yes gene_type:complete